ncbi:MAG TPA: FIST C-terminal domain-containing protein [Burkholderiales bacterium]|nr:FIST C-terminal domain-containing protein [Burkholderiales bacterium]
MSSPTEPFTCGHASSPNWRDAAAQCLRQAGKGPPGANLGFLYITDNFAGEVADMVAYFRTNTGILHWSGTVGMGVIATGREYYDEPAIAIMLCAFEEGGFRVFSGVRSPPDLERQSLHLGGLPANFAVVHGDPRNAQLPRLIGDLAGCMESGFVAGGLTSSRHEVVQIADGVAKGGLSGVLFSDDIVVSTRLTQGCSPIGPRHTITGSQQNIIISLDGRAALDVFREDVGEPEWKNFSQTGSNVFAGLPIAGSDTGDYLVRNLVGIDPVNKLVAIGDVPRAGAQIMFCRRAEPGAAEDMARMLDSIKNGLFGRPRGGLYYSCVGRGPNLFSNESEEATMIREALGEFPLVGFFCNGEISHNRLYGYTGVLTLFL